MIHRIVGRTTMTTPQYRTIPADDGDNNSAGRTAVQSLELETGAHYRLEHASGRPNNIVIITASCIFLACIVLVIRPMERIAKQESSDLSHDLDAETSDHIRKDNEHKSIFCFGDSLTYGMVGGDDMGTYPYATYLEKELALSAPEMTQPKTTVGYLGLPGWTAANMLAHINDATDGMCTMIRKHPKLSLLIILAGTNDIGVMTDAGNAAAGRIIESIADLHKGAIDCAKSMNNYVMHTLAIGIPGSAYQKYMRDAAEVASHVNKALDNLASSDERISYMAFPFAYNDNDSRWSKDGLHLSQGGYAFLAQALAPQVRQILESMQPT